jgi:hypothetical protein
LIIVILSKAKDLLFKSYQQILRFAQDDGLVVPCPSVCVGADP